MIELSENKNTEMFKKNLKTKKDQDQTTDKLSFAFVSATEKVPDNNSDNGDNHSRDSNDGNCFYDRSTKEGEGDTDGKCVNAGSNSENEHIFVIERCIYDIDGFFFIPFPDGLDHHFAADKAEQDKCDPVINAGDIFLELTAEEPADQRHQCLKSTEIKTDDEGLLLVEPAHSKSLTDGNCKSIHGKTDTQ